MDYLLALYTNIDHKLLYYWEMIKKKKLTPLCELWRPFFEIIIRQLKKLCGAAQTNELTKPNGAFELFIKYINIYLLINYFKEKHCYL